MAYEVSNPYREESNRVPVRGTAPHGTKHIPPFAVIEALRNFRGAKAEDDLTRLRYHPGDDFWSFVMNTTLGTIFVGIERDGYIHS